MDLVSVVPRQQGDRIGIDRHSLVRARYGGDNVIVLRGILKVHWGFYTREDPRMHLQSVDAEHEGLYKVWLERDGRRVFEPASEMPSRLRTALERELRTKRSVVEARWTSFLIDSGWLVARLVGRRVELVMYPGFAWSITRWVDLDDELPNIKDKAITAEDVALDAEIAALKVFARRGDDAYHVRLSRVLWTD